MSEERPSAPAAEAGIDDRHPLRVLLGGPWGAVESMAPTVLFVLAYFASGKRLVVAVGVALGVAVVLAGVKLARHEKPVRVLSGLLGVAIAALFAAYQDDPLGFFQIRVLANILSALAFAGSILVKRPLMGVIIGPIMGTGMRWRQDPELLRAYSRASWLWVLLNIIRVVVQIPLIQGEDLWALAAIRPVFYGLVIVTVLLSWVIIKRALPADHPGIRHPRSADGTPL